ncbi:flagellar basal body rod protein FlgB [Breoghania sp.]|uniref:flagellar basal body rod protein FlgB n=1 Tax=Breoghania sp. TaxID=2065378 RepID=UPI002AA94B18|nr:flagellar basal body rod protein FlgB [Breoghania sp.]
MDPVYIMKLASKHQDWLAVREATVAQNVANANTPGYQAKDVESFTALFDKAQVHMRSTQPGHMNAIAATERGEAVEKKDSWDVTYSGNSVSLEQEMMKVNEIARDHALTTSLMKSMHQMMMLSAKVQ